MEVTYLLLISIFSNLMSMAVLVKTDACDDCSQKKIFHGDDLFVCKIKRLNGWKEFQQRYNVKENYTTSNSNTRLLNLKPLVITGIKWYSTPYQENNTIFYQSALNMTFGIKFGNNLGFMAVLMKLESPKLTNVTDTFYSNNPRYRLFDFHTYSPMSSEIYQRYISYPCIWGLEPSSKIRVYFITLTGFPRDKTTNGLSLTYQMTTGLNPLRKFSPYLDMKVWKSTILTVVYPGTSDIHVVFEPAPFRIQYYRVELLNRQINGTFVVVVTKKIYFPTKNYSWIFKTAQSGIYKIKVQPFGWNCSTTCLASESYHFIVKRTEPVAEGMVCVSNPVCVIIVLVVTMSIVVIGVLIRLKLRESRKVFLVELCRNTESKNICRRFGDYLTSNLKCNVNFRQSMPVEYSSSGNSFICKLKNRFHGSYKKHKHLTLIILCDCHLEKAVNILQESRDNVSILSDNVILVNLGNISKDNESISNDQYTIVDLTNDYHNLLPHIHNKD